MGQNISATGVAQDPFVLWNEPGLKSNPAIAYSPSTNSFVIVLEYDATEDNTWVKGIQYQAAQAAAYYLPTTAALTTHSPDITYNHATVLISSCRSFLFYHRATFMQFVLLLVDNLGQLRIYCLFNSRICPIMSLRGRSLCLL